MNTRDFDVIIIGAGPAGLAAALGAKKTGADRVAIIERDRYPGGILPQCIHNGFGLHLFKKDLTGPEYAELFIEKALEAGVEIILNTMVLELKPSESSDTPVSAPGGTLRSAPHSLLCVSRESGLSTFSAPSIVLAMGCRERTRGNIALPGTRPAGIFTAGTAQRFTNIEGYLPGKKIVILGSGDIGMIMARRLTFEGAEVKAVVEVMPFLGGLHRNKVQCLDDFDLPFYLNHTVSYIKGNKRVEGVEIAETGEDGKIIEGTRQFIECDTLLLSVGLIPENELTEQGGVPIDSLTRGPAVDQNFETEVAGIFACGNVLHVSDLVDYVSEDGDKAGTYAALHASGRTKKYRDLSIRIGCGENVGYTVPQIFHILSGAGSEFENFPISFRVKNPLTDVHVVLKADDEIIYQSGIKKIIRPGEMERLVINRKIYDRIVSGNRKSLTVEVLN